jgi:hypothetical protein
MDGLIESTEGLTMVTVTPVGLEVLPSGLKTVKLTVPAAWSTLTGTLAVSWVVLTNVVVSEVLPDFTTAPEMNPPPFRVRVNGTPAGTEVGLTEVTTGAAAAAITARWAARSQRAGPTITNCIGRLWRRTGLTAGLFP